MSDITNIFKATVKTVKTRQKSQGKIFPNDKSILGPHKHRTEFSKRAKDVVNNINQLKMFLQQHRKDYVNSASYSHLSVLNAKMTDSERDQIDVDAQTFIRTCSEAIKVLKNDGNLHRVLPQAKQHREGVVHLLEEYLKVVCKIFSEQRAVRVKRGLDRKRLSKLEPENKKVKPILLENSKIKTKPDTTKTTEANEVKTESQDASVPSEKTEDFSEELSLEEAQLFEQENRQLYEEMNSVVDEVRQIEGKVIEISRLQEIFADKVLEQDSDIDRIADTVVGSSENIKQGNEEIREAMKNNAGLRVWILFILLVCSFSLLFLDWYNP